MPEQSERFGPRGAAAPAAARACGAVRGSVRLYAASASEARPATMNVQRVAALAASPVSGLASAVPIQFTKPAGARRRRRPS